MHSEDHRARLVEEVEENLAWCAEHPDREESRDAAALWRLLCHVRGAQVGVPLYLK